MTNSSIRLEHGWRSHNTVIHPHGAVINGKRLLWHTT